LATTAEIVEPEACMSFAHRPRIEPIAFDRERTGRRVSASAVVSDLHSPTRARCRIGGAMPGSATCANALDHVIVVLFENRSLDNLLGRSYE
jgi:phospholipase C